MFRSKKDVDRYAQDVLRKVRNERERNMRCYNIAVQYFKVRDFESTRRYVCTYLAFKEDSASAHKLLGQTLEALKQKDKALAEYKRSVELETNQPELILKICQLLTDSDMLVDQERARYWLERGEELFPHDPVIFRLKERLLTHGSSAITNANFSKEFEDLISSELKSRPVDVSVHVRMLKLFVETGRTQAAYSHATEIEAKQLFNEELQWYEYLTTLFKIYYDEYAGKISSDCEFFVNWTLVQERYIMLSLAENQTTPPKSITECGNAIYRFDQVLHKAYGLLNNSRIGGQVSMTIKRFADFLEHMSAQLCLHLATFIFKKAKKEQGNWNEAIRLASPLLLFALVFAPPSDEQNSGSTLLSLLEKESPAPAHKKLMSPHWTNAAYNRHCQAGNVLISLAKDSRQQFIEKVLHSCNKNWRERLFQKLFTFEETKSGFVTSHFVNHASFSSPPRSDSSIHRYLNEAIVQIPKQVVACATIHPGSLHHLVWLGVQGMRHSSPCPLRMIPPPDFHTHRLYADLAINDHHHHNHHNHSASSAKATAASHDTINRLDVDSFLYATVLCAGAQLSSEISSGFYSADRPITLPADITCQLCTTEQANWWNAVHKIYSKQMPCRTAVDAKWDLLRGIEVIRAIGNHGLDPMLLVSLAQTFSERAMSFYTSSLSSTIAMDSTSAPKVHNLSALTLHQNPEIGAFEERANLYWKAALPLLERMRTGKAITNPTTRLFEFHREPIEPGELTSLIEEGSLFMARQLMANEEYEEAVEAFKSLRSPYASYHTAEVYLKLAADSSMLDSVMSVNSSMRESMLKEKRSKQTALLEKARDALYLTRDRLHSDLQHPLNRVLPERLKHVEERLDDNEEYLSPSASPNESAGGDYSSRIIHSEMNGGGIRGQRLSYLSSSTPKSKHPSPRVVQTAAVQPDVEKLLLASESRVQECINTANTILADRIEMIVADQCQKLIDVVTSKLTRLEVSVDEMRRDVAKLQHPDDLYMLGDEEDYSEDVLSFPSYVPSSVTAAAAAGAPIVAAPQPAAAAAAYYAPRGVQGTSTVTYGAPPVAAQPTAAAAAAAAAAAHFYSSPQYHTSPVAQAQHAAAAASIGYYGQGALPFSEGQQLPDFLRPNAMSSAITTKCQSPIPVNVVITSSDTLPTGPPPVLPTLSVTIPPKHRLGVLPPIPPVVMAAPVAPAAAAAVINQQVVGAAHEFQISMPITANIPDFQKSPIALQQQKEDEELESRTASPEVEHDPFPDFKPIIALPDEVSLTTGEEGELVLFENRAKLYRFVDKEWKERGIGQLKLLEDTSTKKVRVLMRREQVHKVCANHYLTKDMQLKPMVGSDRAWVWTANDYADQSLQRENFCAKFKTVDEADNFKQAFESAQLTICDSANTSIQHDHDHDQSNNQSPAAVNKSLPSISPMTSSMSPNNAKITLGGFTFSAPPTVKPVDNKAPEKSKSPSQVASQQPAAQNPFNAFSFAPKSTSATTTTPNKTGESILKSPIFSTPTGPNLFLNKTPTTTSSSVSFSTSSTTTVPKTSSAVSTTASKPSAESSNLFGKTDSSNVTLKSALKSSQTPSGKSVTISDDKKVLEVKVPAVVQLRRPHKSIEELMSTDKPMFVDKSGGATDFASLAAKTSADGFQKSDNFKGFEGAGSLVFGGGKAKSDDAAGDDFEPTAEFKPVIPMPELISVKTGEEHEQIVFEQRAKLLRFDQDSKQWKERGIGKMKILHDPSNNTVRLLMRREQVLKVCCNHRLTADFKMEMASNSDRAWTWYAQDYSEGTASDELFALRFKTVEQAGDFKAAIDDALTLIKNTPPAPAHANTSLNLSDVSSSSLVSSDCSGSGSSNTTLEEDNNCWPGPVTITELTSSSSSCSAPAAKIKATNQPSLSEMFKPKPGSWECSGCFVRNNADVKQCPACSTYKDGEGPPVAKSSPSTTSSLIFGSGVFGASNPPGTGFSFGMPPASSTGGTTTTTNENAPKFMMPASTASTTFTFGIPASNTSTSTSTTASNFSSQSNPPKFSFGNVFNANTSSAFGGFGQSGKPGQEGSKPVFGDVSSSKSQETASIFGGAPSVTSSLSSQAAVQKSGLTFSFGGSLSSPPAFVFKGQNDEAPPTADKKFEFNFSGVSSSSSVRNQLTPKLSPAAAESDGERESDAEGHDESGDSISFQPVIPLPDQVAVTTGEEDETSLYTHRAKLFRFVDGEWKERGIGDVKILRHNTTGKLRVLMRREMILKVCLNHVLSADISFTPKDDKTWLWYASDYSEGALQHERFALRFKTPQIAAEFKQAVDRAVGVEGGGGEEEKKEDDKEKEKEEEEETSSTAKTMKQFSFAVPAVSTPTPSPTASTLTTTPTSSPHQPFSFSFKGTGSSTAQRSIFGGASTTTIESKSSPLQASNNNNNKTSSSSSGSKPVADESEDVQVVYEVEVTREQRDAALKLQLPPNFYAYLQAPPCPGCVGCEPEDKQHSSDVTPACQTAPSSDVSSTPISAAAASNRAITKSSPLAAPVLNVPNSLSSAATTLTTTSTVDATITTTTSTPLSFSFSSKPATETSSGSMLFGAGLSGNVQFGKTPTQTQTLLPSEPVPKPATPLFGGGNLGGVAASPNTPTPGFLFKDSLSFSSLASNVPIANTFKKAPDNFKWDVAKPLFGGSLAAGGGGGGGGLSPSAGGAQTKSAKTKVPGADDNDNEGDEEGEEGETVDIHFEPVVPMPPLIQVKTGEEEEEKLFCERAKLFRYDTDAKVWKERGVGEMKILHHPIKRTYRLLLRREQVHKVVCNHLISSELKLEPMMTSEQAFVWTAMNLADEYSEPSLEQLAVKFKNIELANTFKSKMDECSTQVKLVKSAQAKEQKMADLTSQSAEPGTPNTFWQTLGQNHDHTQSSYVHDDDDEEDDEDDDDEDDDDELDDDDIDDEDDVDDDDNTDEID